jgi:hypothetical protein
MAGRKNSMAGSGEDQESTANSYKPIRAVSVTGTFPGFARPHFVPANTAGNRMVLNTVYVQRVLDQRIASFEALDEQIPVDAIPLRPGDTVREGDEPVYVYAFGPQDAVVGNKASVADAINRRFDEIEGKLFAACTAAQFAGLTKKLPVANRRAFNQLDSIDPSSARSWRDTVIFLSSVRRELLTLNVSADNSRLETRNKNGTLEVTLVLRLHNEISAVSKSIEQACSASLHRTGLFGNNDEFLLRIELEGDDEAQLRMPDIVSLAATLTQAKLFLEEKAFLPALQSSTTSTRILNVVKDTRRWIARFRKIGDLVRYMERFRPDVRQASLPFLEIRRLRFEDVYAEFTEKFGQYRWFRTTIADFKEGEAYDPFTLSIYSRTYNNRSGGIRPVGKTGEHEAVVVNIILSGDRYANEWIEPHKRLKCYLKDRRRRSPSRFEENDDSNQSIIEFPNVPILVFTKNAGETDFVYRGTFRYTQVAADEDGQKWFELEKLP